MTAPAPDPWAALFPHLGADRVSYTRDDNDEPPDDYDIDARMTREENTRMGHREDPR